MNKHKIFNVACVVVGWLLHTAVWASLGGFRLQPFSPAAWKLHFMELPVDTLYFDPSFGLFRYGSLIIGGIYWGFILLGIVKILQKIFSSGARTAAA